MNLIEWMAVVTVTIAAAAAVTGSGGLLWGGCCTNPCLSAGIAKVLDVAEHNVT